MKKKVNQGFRLVALSMLAVASFAGVASVIQGDPVIRYVIAGVFVLFAVKEVL